MDDKVAKKDGEKARLLSRC